MNGDFVFDFDRVLNSGGGGGDEGRDSGDGLEGGRRR